MAIYTRTGDKGKTSLGGGERVPKTDSRVEAYGSVDELNACLGAALSLVEDGELVDQLAPLRNDLMLICSEIARPDSKRTPNSPALGPDRTVYLEKLIDAMDEKLPSLRNFILPGGCPGAAALYFAATVCRRVERRVLTFSEISGVRREILVYLNRLSDLLFTAGRMANFSAGVEDTPWSKS